MVAPSDTPRLWELVR